MLQCLKLLDCTLRTLCIQCKKLKKYLYNFIMGAVLQLLTWTASHRYSVDKTNYKEKSHLYRVLLHNRRIKVKKKKRKALFRPILNLSGHGV